MCYFNLCDNSQLLEENIQQLEKLALEVYEREGWDLSWLTSWLPNLGWLKHLFVIILLIALMIIVACYLIQCILFCIPRRRNKYVET